MPFGEPRLEGWAFRALGLGEEAGWRRSDGDVRHYTFARLYSADPRWRGSADYVAFLCLRAAAAGDGEFAQFCRTKLPAAVPACDLCRTPRTTATFRRYDDGPPPGGAHPEDVD